MRANYWGKVVYRHPTDPTNDEYFGAKITLDASVAYKLMDGFTIAVGANNLLNTFPDQQTKAANITDGQFTYSRRVQQFGINGGFYYLRVQYVQ